MNRQFGFLSSVLATALSPSVFALSDEEVADACLETARAKLAHKAAGKGCLVDLSQMRVTRVNNRWYNPSKYVWYHAPARQGGEKLVLSTLVQFYNGSCF